MSPLEVSDARSQGSFRTFERDDTLPRVPLPDLEASCGRFLQWCEPLLSQAEREVTEDAVRRDLEPGSVLRRMHEALVDYNAQPDVRSWLDEFWRDRYLGRRDRIAVNANFFFLLAGTGADQLTRATAIIDGVLAHKALLDAEVLPPAERRGQPLSMDQNRFLYAATRIPGEPRDRSRTAYSAQSPGPSRSGHIVVFHHGRMARLNVVDGAGSPLPPPVLYAALAQARSQLADASNWPPSLGPWTSLPRAQWAPIRAELLRSHADAAQVLDQIETALFCLTLDDAEPSTLQEAGDLLLAGDSRDRWFDKSLSFVVFADGQAGINGEHCELDGTTIASLIDFIAERSMGALELSSRPDSTAIPRAQPLGLNLSQSERESLERATAEFTAYAKGVTSGVVTATDLGSDAIKAVGMSPDAFVQAALQATQVRVRGVSGATYESIATRHWRGGRTEAMRVVTPPMRRFAESMSDPRASVEVRLKALEQAVAAHGARARECQEGKAPEQHLWELQMLARRRGEQAEPALHSSPGWGIMRADWLSTSSVPSPQVRLFGFGATTSTCIGVAYALMPGQLTMYLSAPQGLADTVGEFASVFPPMLREMLTMAGEPR